MDGPLRDGRDHIVFARRAGPQSNDLPSRFWDALAVTEGVMTGTLDIIEEAGGAVKLLECIGFGASDLARLKALLWQPSQGSSKL